MKEYTLKELSHRAELIGRIDDLLGETIYLAARGLPEDYAMIDALDMEIDLITEELEGMKGDSTMSVKFNHNRLEARINEVFGCNEAFGEELGLGKNRVNSRLKGKTEFSLSEIQKAVELLNIPFNQVDTYFFKVEYFGL